METVYNEYEKMYIAYGNVHTMLRNRGYDMTLVPAHMTPLELARKLLDVGEFLYTVRRATDNDSVGVFFCSDPKLGVGHLRNYCKHCDTELHIRHCLVLTYEVTPFATAFVLDQLRQGQYDIEIFTYEEKQFDLISHARVPPHSILTEEQKQKLLKDFHITHENLLPHRRLDDTLRRYYNLPVGTVTETLHTTGSMERAPYYRIVMDDT